MAMEGEALVGEPTFVAIDGGRFRCVETGHEMLDFERERYGASKKCRDALFDRAVEEGRAPLNFFERRPEYRDKIVCKLTGAVVNKNEQAVWKHLLGKSFQKKLASQEKKKASEKSSKKDKAHIMEDGTANKNDMDFWMPPEDDRDGGETEGETKLEKKSKKKRDVKAVDGSQKKTKKKTEGSKLKREDKLLEQADVAKEKKKRKKCEAEEGGQKDAERRMKRLALAVGPSSFASRKKKRKIELAKEVCEAKQGCE